MPNFSRVLSKADTDMLVGETWSFSLCLGALVQTKGLMEVVVLTVLLENEIISVTAFSALTLMAVISTGLVMPLARLLLPRTKSEAGLQRAERKLAVMSDHARS